LYGHSHHPFAPFGHVVYLNRDGSIKMSQPDDAEKDGFKNLDLRARQPIELTGDHHFKIILADLELTIDVDDCHHAFPVGHIPKLLSPGLIRFQAYMTWMGIQRMILR
jgi:hypothetical protein